MESKVAKILSDKQLVITGGQEAHHEVGQQFQIIGKHGQEVTDPDTGTIIGQLDEVKATVVAKIVYPHMTLVESETISDGPSPLTRFATPNLAASMSAIYGHTTQKRLHVDSSQISGETLETDTPIQIGDLAQKL